MPTVAVIIPCLNEEKFLPNLLDCLLEQSQVPVEVIVADSGSDDKTIEVAKSYAHKLSVQITKATRTPGAARNAGAKMAGSEYLLFIDADITLPTDFIQEIKKYLNKNHIDFISPKFKSDGGHFVDSYLF
jgi:glycosyltransferase involved in cell wall biosynthesis